MAGHSFYFIAVRASGAVAALLLVQLARRVGYDQRTTAIGIELNTKARGLHITDLHSLSFEIRTWYIYQWLLLLVQLARTSYQDQRTKVTMVACNKVTRSGAYHTDFTHRLTLLWLENLSRVNSILCFLKETKGGSQVGFRNTLSSWRSRFPTSKRKGLIFLGT